MKTKQTTTQNINFTSKTIGLVEWREEKTLYIIRTEGIHELPVNISYYLL